LLADELRRWRLGEPTQTRPPRWPQRLWGVARKNPMLTLGALLLALVGPIVLLAQPVDA
jgi:hypothetical protein